MVEPPTGTVTFLFTDIEGSTERWEAEPDAMARALARHDDLVRGAITAHGGYVFATGGDGFAAAFDDAEHAVDAAVRAQARLAEEAGADGFDLRVRMGMATGRADERDADYFGPVVNLAARISAAAHGGQILLSTRTAEDLPPRYAPVDLGPHRLRGFGDPMQILQIGGAAGDHPPLAGLDADDHDLPVVRSPLFGFTPAVDQVIALLDDHRCVSITGVGGIGKTRLAVAVATRTLADHDLTRFVDLSPLTKDEQVLTTLCATLGVEPGEAGAVVRHIGHRRVLLVFDNCEHLLDPVAVLVEQLVAECPELRILATSREALGVDDEHVRSVRPLSIESAVELFVERATARDAAVHFDETAMASIANICAQLDRIPLAIELAAGRTTHMSVDDIDRNLDDRFRLLSGGRRRARQRQETLQAAMDWSYRLLEPEEQQFLQTASVFQGGFTAEAIGAVSGIADLATLDLIGSLVDKSLVEVVHVYGTTRYGLLETVRIYSRERLVAEGDAEDVRIRHAAHYLADLEALDVDDMVRSGVLLHETGTKPDLWNQLAMLEWFDGSRDLDRTALAAGLVTLRHGASVWDGQANPYLGRPELFDRTHGRTRAVYGLASTLSANVFGQFEDQLRFTGPALESAESMVRVALLLIGANAASIFDPAQVPAMVDEALDLIGPEDDPLRRVAESRRIDALTMMGSLDEAHEALVGIFAAGPGLASIDRFTSADWETLSELAFIKLLSGRDEDFGAGFDTWALAPGNVSYRVRCVRAILFAREHDAIGSAAALTDAADTLGQQPFPLTEHDVAIAAAIRSVHLGEGEHACRLLATVPLRVRSPASYQLLLHARRLVAEGIGRDRVSQLRAEMSTVDPAAFQRAEMSRLRMIAAG